MFTRALVGSLLTFAVAAALANPPAIVVGQTYACDDGTLDTIYGELKKKGS